MGLTKYTTIKGKTVSTIPDAETKNVVYEIKDVKKLFNTKQIKAERQHAKEVKKDFKIVTGEKTKVARTIPENELIRRTDIGPQEH